MTMLRKLARRVLFLLVGLAVLGGILYAVGLRIVFDGGGGTQLRLYQIGRQAGG